MRIPSIDTCFRDYLSLVVNAIEKEVDMSRADEMECMAMNIVEAKDARFKSFAQADRERKADVQSMFKSFTQADRERKADVQSMFKSFAQADRERKADVQKMMAGFHKEQADASRAWKKHMAPR